jgi:hypothetical protein
MNSFNLVCAIVTLFLIVFPYATQGKLGKHWYSGSFLVSIGMFLTIHYWILRFIYRSWWKPNDTSDVAVYGATEALIVLFLTKNTDIKISDSWKRFVSLCIIFLYIQSSAMMAGKGWLRAFIWFFGGWYLVAILLSNR